MNGPGMYIDGELRQTSLNEVAEVADVFGS
jgi:hypothetical protein